MTVTAHKLGPGILKFGETASEQEFSSHTTKTELEPKWKDEDPVPTLSGEEYQDEGSFEGTLSGEFLQEYGMQGLVAWTWKNTGKVVPFTFRPRGDQALTFTGECMIRAVKVGGDVKKANTAEFEFKLTKMPEFKDGSTGTSSTTTSPSTSG